MAPLKKYSVKNISYFEKTICTFENVKKATAHFIMEWFGFLTFDVYLKKALIKTFHTRFFTA